MADVLLIDDEKPIRKVLGLYLRSKGYGVITAADGQSGLASKYGRYGYRRITALLRRNGWQVNHKRVESIWRQEGLKLPKKQPKRGRLWLRWVLPAASADTPEPCLVV
jgi:hypothetical protein